MTLQRRLRPAFAGSLACWMALALPSACLADLVNTAQVAYQDNLGIIQQRASNTVTVIVLPVGTAPPIEISAPLLSLPAYLPINAQISARYTGSAPASYFSWSFTHVASIPLTGTASQASHASSYAPSASLTTAGPQANLGSVQLSLGPYLVSVTVTDTLNRVSPSASAYVTLVPADLSGIRVYPNPWRSGRHTGPVIFENLTLNTSIEIFTVSGHAVKSLPLSSTNVTWDLTNDSGDKVASGVYLYLIVTDGGLKKTGQIVVIR